MATGDAAAAKGLRVIAATKALNLGYDDLNKKGDEIAAEIDARAAAITAEANARIAADALKFDAAKVIYTTGATPAYVAGAIWLKKV